MTTVDVGESVIEARSLTRYYGSVPAVQDLDLTVPHGGVFAFLGRNGSGKTTAIRMLLGLLPATRGEARVLGHDSATLPPGMRGRIGYLAEGHPVFGWMRAGDMGRFEASFHAAWNQRLFGSILEHFGIDPKAKAKSLSRGQRAGLCLACVLAPDPELLVLDDPCLGLDPVARHAFLEAVIMLTRDKQRTIFFSSHLLPDVERVADHIAILDRSVLRVSCPMEVFRRRVRRVVLTYDGRPPADPLPEVKGLLQVTRGVGELDVIFVSNGSVEAQLAPLRPQGVEPASLSFEQAVVAFLRERGQGASLLERVAAADAAWRPEGVEV